MVQPNFLKIRFSAYSLHIWLFNALFAVLLAGPYNFPLWRYMLHIYPLQSDGSVLFLGLVFAVLAGFFYIVATIFSLVRGEKTLAIVITLANAVVLYFMNRFSVVIDATMIENVLQTDAAETRELITIGFVIYFILLGVVPAAIIYKIRVVCPQNTKGVLKNFLTILVPLTMIGFIAATHFQSFASLVRNHREIRYYVVPNNYINSIYKTATMHMAVNAQKSIPLVEVSKDRSGYHDQKNTLFVLVIGEAARAESFSLNGYQQKTSPLLMDKDIFNFTNTYSCGTSTAVSLPCMLSPWGRKDFDNSKKGDPNNLFQLVSRAGFKGIWVDNNSGCKGLCANLPTMNSLDLLKQYGTEGQSREAFDMAMLQAMDDMMADADGDIFVVLHQKGSHGPAYYLRTPLSFHRFKPVCMTSELNRCSQDEIRNAYDNTILYTDYFLSSLIDKLQGLSQTYDTAMVYMSDHGESLGEKNIYLHGLPYLIAPDQQKHIPFFMWLSDGFSRQQRIEKSCLQAKRDSNLTHDNLFHSVLDILDIDTSLKIDAMSIFDDCRELI